MPDNDHNEARQPDRPGAAPEIVRNDLPEDEKRYPLRVAIVRLSIRTFTDEPPLFSDFAIDSIAIQACSACAKGNTYNWTYKRACRSGAKRRQFVDSVEVTVCSRR